MAQLIVTAATSAVSNLANPANPIRNFVLKQGAKIATTYVGNLLFNNKRYSANKPSLETIGIQNSQEGNPIYQLYGKRRISGQIIWASKFTEKTSTSSRGKNQSDDTNTEYYASFALGLCEGEINTILKCWIDGKLAQLNNYSYRIYRGSETQEKDDLIKIIEGDENTPAFRGLAYIVFENFPLTEFGNRIPIFSFEIFKGFANDEDINIKAVTMLPGSGEFSLSTSLVHNVIDNSKYVIENAHNGTNNSNITYSLDLLKNEIRNCENVSLIVSWFADSYVADDCKIFPAIESIYRKTEPYDWKVSDDTRDNAKIVQTISVMDENGEYVDIPAYGGTPSDKSVIEAIQEIKNKGFKALFYPFILMNLPDFGWRGEIAPSADNIIEGVNNFFGDSLASDFQINDGEVHYSGDYRYSFSHMILHYAHLCKLAGGVDAFLIGSELKNITKSHKDGFFPACEKLIKLSNEVRKILGENVKISYAADWSEYNNHSEGANIYFHLDKLWGHNNIDFIGIDNYMPLSDWRDGENNLDRNIASSIYDINYLQLQIENGEGYDYYYKNINDRNSQNRTPIIDTQYNEDWVYRFKDIRSFWENDHYHRINGLKNTSSTEWQKKSKPIWFTELGCAAIDKGSNQPNVFIDEKSRLSNIPYFSNGNRDDKMQKSFINAHISYWNNANINPTSSIYNGNMIDTDHIYIYSWDARPFPYFPAYDDIWRDAENWYKGHWISGRYKSSKLSNLIDEICAKENIDFIDTSLLDDDIDSYLLDKPYSIRDILEQLSILYQFDFVQKGNKIQLVPKNKLEIKKIDNDDLIYEGDILYKIEKTQLKEIPKSINVGFIDESKDYSVAIASYAPPLSDGFSDEYLNFPITMTFDEAKFRARSIYHEISMNYETINLSLSCKYYDLEPGDVINISSDKSNSFYQIDFIEDDIYRKINAHRIFFPAENQFSSSNTKIAKPTKAIHYGNVLFEILDLPFINDNTGVKLAAFTNPWPTYVNYALEIDNLNWQALITQSKSNVMGYLVDDLMPAKEGVIDYHNKPRIKLFAGNLSSVPDLLFFAGNNLIAVEKENSTWELIQFKNADINENGEYVISNLLRGVHGTSKEINIPNVKNARIVLLDENILKLELSNNYLNSNLQIACAARNQEYDDASKKSFTYNAISQRYYSPIHLRISKKNNEYYLSWLNRIRNQSDVWKNPDDWVYDDNILEKGNFTVSIFDGENLITKEELSNSDYKYPETFKLPNLLVQNKEYKIILEQNSPTYGPSVASELIFSLK